MSRRSDQRLFADHVLDLMQTVGPVTARAMFGGHGLFLDGLMFALIVDSTLYLKVDDGNRADFTERGLECFTYVRQGKTVGLSYHQAPEEALEDAGVMNRWANSAYGAALRAALKKDGRG